MASMASLLQRIKDNPLGIISHELVESVCREHGHTWRDRELDPATTIALFLQQIVGGNTPCSEVRHIAAAMDWPDAVPRFTAQAYCDARIRLPLAVYQTLLDRVCQSIVPLTRRAENLWHGHRTFHLDGSTFSMPDTANLRKAFGMPSGQKKGCGFPVAHLLVLFSAATGLLLDVIASPMYSGDLAGTAAAHLHLSPGDILIADDSFSGYTHLAMLQNKGLHGLFPVHHLRIVDFKKGRPYRGQGQDGVKGMPHSRWIKSLGKEDQLVEYFKPKDKPAWVSQEQYDALPDSIIVRELRRTVVRPGLGKITLVMVTTLLDAKKYTVKDLLELRLRRWDVETNIGHMKTTMKMDVLRCKSEQGVRKELAMFALTYNLVRTVMMEASRRQEVPVSRISFADAYKWMRHARPGDVLPALIVNPHRPDRIEPRCRKRRPKKYTLMNKPRKELRELLKNKRKKA